MTALDTYTENNTDLEILQALEFQPDDTPCSFNGCPNAAAWLLLCPYDRNPEECCGEHRAVLLGWPEDEPITFDKTCGHHPDIGSCLWEPIK